MAASSVELHLSRAASPPSARASDRVSARYLFDYGSLAVLDRYFVHRLRMVTGKDGNPLNEVELMCDSPMNNDGVLHGNNVIKLIPDSRS